MKWINCLCLVPAALLALGPSPCLAREKPAGPWSLNDCIGFALTNQAGVKTAANSVTIAQNRSTKAHSDYLPQASLRYNAFRWGSDGVLNKTATGTAISVTQNVFDGGLREAGAQAARYDVTQSKASLERVRQAVIYDVTRAYCEALRARHLADAAQINVNYNEQLRDLVQGLAAEGEAAKVDVLPVEAQLANARVNLLDAQNSARVALIELQAVIGLAPTAGFDVQELEGTPKPDAAPLDAQVKWALENRPDVVGSAAALGAARASLRLARINLYPRPVIAAEYQRQISGGFTTSGSEMVGGIAWNIFDGAANRAAYREAEASRSTAEIQQAQVERDIRAEVESAYLNLTSARERLAASTVSLDAAEANHEAQKGRFDTGVGILLDVLYSEVQLVAARSSKVEAKYDYLIALAQLEYAVGRSGEDR